MVLELKNGNKVPEIFVQSKSFFTSFIVFGEYPQADRDTQHFEDINKVTCNM